MHSKGMRISAYLLTGMILIFSLSLANGMLHHDIVRAESSYNANAIGGCAVFPSNNIWNYDISHLPVAANSASYVAAIGLTSHLHPDFGAGLYNGGPIGFPYLVVPGSQPSVPVSFNYASESDPGPYPVSLNAPIEGGSQSSGDRHVRGLLKARGSRDVARGARGFAAFRDCYVHSVSSHPGPG